MRFGLFSCTGNHNGIAYHCQTGVEKEPEQFRSDLGPENIHGDVNLHGNQ